MKNDPINPNHYKGDMPVQCIDISEKFNFCLGNVIKYVWRAGKKEGSDILEDLQKADWYLNREIFRLEQARGIARTSQDKEPSKLQVCAEKLDKALEPFGVPVMAKADVECIFTMILEFLLAGDYDALDTVYRSTAALRMSRYEASK